MRKVRIQFKDREPIEIDAADVKVSYVDADGVESSPEPEAKPDFSDIVARIKSQRGSEGVTTVWL